MGGSFTTIHGIITADPEKRTYKKNDGTEGSMTNFGVAVDARFGDKTYFWDCTAFGKTGEIIYAHFKKGSEIVCYGEHVYNEKDKKRYWNLNVDKFDFCGKKAESPAQDTMEEVNDATPF